jgi:hypothetical protein
VGVQFIEMYSKNRHTGSEIMLTECSLDRLTNLDHPRAIVTHDRLDIFFGHFSRVFLRNEFSLYSLFFQTIMLNELAVSIRKGVAMDMDTRENARTINDLITKIFFF